MQIVAKPNKALALAEVKRAILEHCDPDIQEAFGLHNMTLEPLLCQMIRELRHLQGATDHATDQLRSQSRVEPGYPIDAGSDRPQSAGEDLDG